MRSITGGATIQSALVAQSNADILNEWEGTLNVLSPAPVAAQYQSVTQQAMLVFLCADGTNARVALPAPKLSIFLADGQTVDATKITAIISACVGNLLSASLSPATAFLSGILQRPP